MLAAAASYYKATLAVTTGLSAPFNNLAVIYKQQVVVFSFTIVSFFSFLFSIFFFVPFIFNQSSIYYF